MAGEPTTFLVGQAVSARFMGSFASGRVTARSIELRCRVLFEGESTPRVIPITDSRLDGRILPCSMALRHPEDGTACPAIVRAANDRSLYTITFEDGDTEDMRRGAKLRPAPSERRATPSLTAAATTAISSFHNNTSSSSGSGSGMYVRGGSTSSGSSGSITETGATKRRRREKPHQEGGGKGRGATTTSSTDDHEAAQNTEDDTATTRSSKRRRRPQAGEEVAEAASESTTSAGRTTGSSRQRSRRAATPTVATRRGGRGAAFEAKTANKGGNLASTGGKAARSLARSGITYNMASTETKQQQQQQQQQGRRRRRRAQRDEWEEREEEEEMEENSMPQEIDASQNASTHSAPRPRTRLVLDVDTSSGDGSISSGISSKTVACPRCNRMVLYSYYRVHVASCSGATRFGRQRKKIRPFQANSNSVLSSSSGGEDGQGGHGVLRFQKAVAILAQLRNRWQVECFYAWARERALPATSPPQTAKAVPAQLLVRSSSRRCVWAPMRRGSDVVRRMGEGAAEIAAAEAAARAKEAEEKQEIERQAEEEKRAMENEVAAAAKENTRTEAKSSGEEEEAGEDGQTRRLSRRRRDQVVDDHSAQSTIEQKQQQRQLQQQQKQQPLVRIPPPSPPRSGFPRTRCVLRDQLGLSANEIGHDLACLIQQQ